MILCCQLCGRAMRAAGHVSMPPIEVRELLAEKGITLKMTCTGCDEYLIGIGIYAAGVESLRWYNTAAAAEAVHAAVVGMIAELAKQ